MEKLHQNRQQSSDNMLRRAEALYEEGSLDEAEKICQRLVYSRPNNIEAAILLGTISIRLGNLEEAIHLMEKAISIKPTYAAYVTHGIALYYLKRFDEALASYGKAIFINPSGAEAYSNRGILLSDLGRYNIALADYDKAIALKSNYAEAYNNRGRALYNLKQYGDALECYNNAIAINSNYADAQWNKSVSRLTLGQYEEGWQLHEWRWKRSDVDKRELRPFTMPLWLGDYAIANKTILLHAEQGLGDTIQFCRYATMVENLGAKVVLEVQKPLVRLIATLQGFCTVIARGDDVPEVDYRCPLLSLPLALKTSLDNVPTGIPYLHPEQENRRLWRKRLGTKSRPRVGLSWSGASWHKNDKNRSIPLSMLAPLLQHDLEYHSVQKGVRADDAEFLSTSKIIAHDNDLRDFLDTASLVSEMDIILSVDTSVAHLAGALGKPVWILLPFVPDFRWMTDRADSPWYPTARLFRQSQIGDWDSVIAKVAAELAAIALKFLPTPQIAPDLLSKAVALHQTGNLLEAAEIYQEIIAASPEPAEALTLLGTLHAQRGEREQAIRLLERAISISPSAEAYYNLGLIFQRLNRHADALSNYTKAISIDPKYADAHNNRGLALHRLGRHVDALKSLDKALTISPRHSGAHKNRALILPYVK